MTGEVMPVPMPPMPKEARGIPNDARLEIHLNQCMGFIQSGAPKDKDQWRVALLTAEALVDARRQVGRLQREIEDLQENRGPAAGIDGLV